nr:cytochrome P450 716B1-like [Tanacetum cinerariifolium]
MVSIKKVNNVAMLQALIDRKKVIVTEDIIRQDLRLDDADGVDCLPTEDIFAELARLPGTNSIVPWPRLSSALSQAATKDEGEENEVPAVPTPPSLTHELTSPSQEPITSPLQPQPAPPSSPLPQTQPTITSTSDMTLLNTLLKTCTTLSYKVAAMEQDKVAQALEILKLKRRVKKLKRQRRSKSSGGCIQTGGGGGRIEEIDTDEEITLVDMEIQDDLDVELQGRLEEKDEVNASDKKVNAAKPTVFDDEEVTLTMAQTLIKMKAKKARLLDEAQELQQQYDQKQENISWNVVVEQMQEKHLDNIRKYQSLKRKPISIAQARKNMIVYLKNMAGYKIAHFKGSHSTHDTPIDDPKKMSKEDVKNILVVGITQAYQSFEDMLKDFDREDLDALWRLTKEKFSTVMPTEDKEKVLLIELKRLYEPNATEVQPLIKTLTLNVICSLLFGIERGPKREKFLLLFQDMIKDVGIHIAR